MEYLRAQNLFHLSSREMCISKLNKIKIPIKGEPPRQKGAVLVPLCIANGNVALLLTMRYPSTSCINQISYPLGTSLRDETPEQTALKVAKEEIGLRKDKIEVWGCGPQFPGINNKVLITPVIAQINNLTSDDLKVSKNVQEVFAVAVSSLCDRSTQIHTQYKNGYIVPAFTLQGYKIWGLTAYITHALLQSLLPNDVYNNNWVQKKVPVFKY